MPERVFQILVNCMMKIIGPGMRTRFMNSFTASPGRPSVTERSSR